MSHRDNKSSSTIFTDNTSSSATSTNDKLPSTAYADTKIPSTQPDSISPPAPAGQWFVQEPGQKWSDRWASATSEERYKYAVERAGGGGHGMDIMYVTCAKNVEAPKHWVHDDTV
ncbi:6d1c7d44-60eb-4a7d-92f0-d11e9bad435f [Sclerotinia trifoliorum]|uniref:6d1c7d44-60eb-4a7d-92f0-d11e9bad435f n=1 Tax=Sclerotinia trifoliorum TaxID=28548 RepID=A0A8H2VL34_9HELO|nr:6d1c7d44-60eb-4a7d-92f0-d11e9bad435f [Sclerotinia trifoliorum]